MKLNKRTRSIFIFCGLLALLGHTMPAGWCSPSEAIMPVFEVEPILEAVIPITVLEENPESQLSALEILEQAYQLYLTDRLDGYSAQDAEVRLVGTLKAIGFESRSASTLLKTLEHSTYQVPDALMAALRQISQL